MTQEVKKAAVMNLWWAQKWRNKIVGKWLWVCELLSSRFRKRFLEWVGLVIKESRSVYGFLFFLLFFLIYCYLVQLFIAGFDWRSMWEVINMHLLTLHMQWGLEQLVDHLLFYETYRMKTKMSGSLRYCGKWISF